MPKDWFEYVIIAFILFGIAAAFRRNGQSNPETTGQLGKKIAHLENKVGTVSRDVAAIDGKVGSIDRRVDDIERRSAKASDIERLERLVVDQGKMIIDLAAAQAKYGEGLAAIQASGDQRGKQLDRLYDFIVERGMSK